MIQSMELLRTYVRGIRKLSGAGSVSLFVPASRAGASKPILMHHGNLSPVPELVELAGAAEFHGKKESELEEAEGPSALLRLQHFPSRSPNCRLIRVPTVESLLSFPSNDPTDAEPARRRRKSDGKDPFFLATPAPWIGLRFEQGRDPFVDGRPLDLPSFADNLDQMWVWLLALGGALASHTRHVSDLLDDPATGLPGRAEFQEHLRQWLEKARETGRPLTLLMLNPDDFVSVNERLGREAGDRVMRELAERFRISHRASDIAAKYGGAIFTSLLIDTDIVGGRTVAEKLINRLTEAAFLDGAVRLGFSLGIASFDPSDEAIREPLDLVRRADQALNAAKRAGGGRLAVWSPGSEAEEVSNLDRLTGIFTGNMAKDYRNMVLLLDTASVVASGNDVRQLAAQAVEKLFSSFRPDCAGLFEWSPNQGFRLIAAVSKGAHSSEAVASEEPLKIEKERLALLDQARTEARAVDARFSDSANGAVTELHACAVPLIVTDECLGCLYMEGHADALVLDSSDLIFLRALTAQLAVALDRARLSERQKRWQEQESQRLHVELEHLRQALQEAKLVYRSEKVEAVLATARRVAPTDATVLIMGESGTGKELIARTIHQLSPRRNKPLVVVDCGAIPTTLIESELFGHEKGAYTGAQQRKIGRLVEADRSTVLLDEIGELPLEVQGKLLRFVQEKEFIPVGGTGTRPRSVDVRLIAATNRDLSSEVLAGNFRKDLYYRLNVVRLLIPPLRERPDDILYLANHFLEKYSVLYRKNVRRFTPEAEALMVRHSWPGNVRELQNQIMQAVILCEAEELGPTELALREESAAPPDSMPHVGSEGALFVRAGAPPAAARSSWQPDRPGPITAAMEVPIDVLWDRLGLALGRQVETVLVSGARLSAPLGRWLTEDLLLAADARAGGVARRAATLLGIPETTFRRRHSRVVAEREAGLMTRLPSWQEVRDLLALLVRGAEVDGQDLVRRARQVLLGEILGRVGEDAKTGSALFGVTALTFRRRSNDVKAGADASLE